MLTRRRQQAVASARPQDEEAAEPAAADLLEKALDGGALPVSRVPASLVDAGPTWAVAAARASAETLVRACWPGTLAPRLVSTRLGFTYVAARATRVGVTVPDETGDAADIAARLRLLGFAAEDLRASGSAWSPPAYGAVYFRRGARAAAAVLADDLGLTRRDAHPFASAPRRVVYAAE